jgi:hypothetical protein
MQHLSGKPRGEMTYLLYARYMGSYLCGKLTVVMLTSVSAKYQMETT